MSRSTEQLRQLWNPPVPENQMRRRWIAHGLRLWVHPLTIEAWGALDCVMLAHDYRVMGNSKEQWNTGGYNNRPITGGTKPSLHAAGIAADYNASRNPYRADNRLVTDMPRKMVDDILRIRTRGGAGVFRWGGDFTTVKDAMHYEVVASPDELRQRIDWSTVRLPLCDPRRPETWPILQAGDRGPTVLTMQMLLVTAGHLTQSQLDTGPGVFGAQTESAVTAYQRSRGLEVTGVIELGTRTALLTRQPDGPSKPAPQPSPPPQPADPPADLATVIGQAADRIAHSVSALPEAHRHRGSLEAIELLTRKLKTGA